jgi:hypothetical protein
MTRQDSGYTPFKGRHREPPVPVLIEQCWRVIGPSQRVIVCGIYESVAGRVEVRCHWSESFDALIRSEVASDIDIALDVAAAWKQAAIDKGFFDVQ